MSKYHKKYSLRKLQTFYNSWSYL